MFQWAKKVGTNIASSKFTQKLTYIFSKQKIDDNILQEFKKLLIESDFGYSKSQYFIDIIKSKKIDQSNQIESVKKILQEQIINILSASKAKLQINPGKLNVFLFVGVNGAGKTTSIGKLAHKYNTEHYKVKIAACDTFRAAAVNQMKVWASDSKIDMISGDPGIDPASVAYRAMQSSMNDGTELLLIDTAGRLQNNKNLMNELTKISRVLKKIDDTAPHYTLLVLDAINGQNTLSQCKNFLNHLPINGLVTTKLDGTAKAGSLVSICDTFKIPIYFASTGEKIGDIEEFSIKKYVESLIYSQ